MFIVENLYKAQRSTKVKLKLLISALLKYAFINILMYNLLGYFSNYGIILSFNSLYLS